jgi:hypothetical protein
VDNTLRRWKCRNCSRSNETAIELDGTGKCTHCARLTSVQPSRVRDGKVLPATYPTKMGSPRSNVPIRSLGEV